MGDFRDLEGVGEVDTKSRGLDDEGDREGSGMNGGGDW